MGRQYDKQHAVAMLYRGPRGQPLHRPRRWLCRNAGGTKDTIGVSESNAAVGDVFPVITGFSALVTAVEPIAQHAYVKPAADGSGMAATGTATDHCGRAMEAAVAGQLVEVRILPHRHT